jgi:hypothetical protein
LIRHRAQATPTRYAEKADPGADLAASVARRRSQGELSYQWKFGRGARCMKYLYATQAKMAATTIRRMVLAMVKTLLLGVAELPLVRDALSHL